jgi:hypothetical protein
MTKDRLTRLEGLYRLWKSPDGLGLAHIHDPSERASADAFIETVFNAIALHTNAMHDYVAKARAAGRQPDPANIERFHQTIDSYLSDIEKVMFMPAPPRDQSEAAAIEQPNLDHDSPAIEQIAEFLVWGEEHWPDRGDPAERDTILQVCRDLLDDYSPPETWRQETNAEQADRRSREATARWLLDTAGKFLEPLGIRL